MINVEEQNLIETINFGEVLMHMKDPVLFIRNGVFVECNDAAVQIFGAQSKEQILNTRPGLLSPPYQNGNRSSAKAAVEMMALVMEKGSHRFEWEHQTIDGQIFPVEVLQGLIRSGDEDLIFVQFHDISDRKRGQIALEDATRKAQMMVQQATEASKVKDEFLANMSHEIRTPMNGVIGMTDLLMDTDLNGEQKKYIKILRSSGEAMLVVINDIFDFSKIEAGKIELEDVAFDIISVISDFSELMKASAAKQNLHWRYTIDDSISQHLQGDPGRLRQILTNLAGNALKFTSEGWIHLRVERVEENDSSVHLRFSIQDTGIGIPANRTSRLFKAFSQVDSSTNRKYGGTGLGLTISKKLVEMMGGQIGVQSVEGEGSTFFFTLALRKQDLETVRAFEDVLSEVNDASGPLELDVLVAEDNLTNQIVISRILKKMGCTVTVVSNGLEAVQILKTETFDLVLMDCMMPEMDGYEATQAIRDESSGVLNQAIPIIALTANALDGDRQNCLASGMNDYVAKPLNKVALRAALLRVQSDTGDEHEDEYHS